MNRNFKTAFGWILIVFFQATACKKEPTDNPNNPPLGNDTIPVNVLNDNSGFSRFHEQVLAVSAVSGVTTGGGAGVCDFTIDADNNFNAVYYATQPTQQDAFRAYYRISKNIGSNALVSLPDEADKFDSKSQIQRNIQYDLMQFRPYTNFFTYAKSTTESSFPYSNKVNFYGDINCLIKSPNPIGSPDVCYKYPCMNPIAGIGNNGFGYFILGHPNPDYLFSSNSSFPFSFFNNSGSPVVASFLESSIYLPRRTAIFCRADSIIAYAVDSGFALSNILSVININSLGNAGDYKTIRHYSTDGNILGMMIMKENTKQVWTCIYNFNSKVLTKGLDGVSIEYSGSGSDFDVDEIGNVYYTGYAGNGSNTSGVSIYKKAVSGAVNLIGSDNLLKFGEVVKLKVLRGKVYFAVVGKRTGSTNYQVSILKQE